MFGKSILCQNTVRKSAAAVVSGTRRARAQVSEDGRDRRDGRDVRWVVRDG